MTTSMPGPTSTEASETPPETPQKLAPGVVPVVQRDDYRIAFEQVCGATFGHITVRVPWSREVAARVLRDVDLVMGLHGGPIFACATETDPVSVRKHAKFCRSIGFQFHKMVPCADGEARPVYIRSS